MRRFLGRMSLRANRGRFFLQFLIFFSTVMVFLKTYFPQVPFNIAVILTILLGTIGTVAIGYLDEKKGIWRYELEHSARINPFFYDMNKKIDKILEVVENESKRNN